MKQINQVKSVDYTTKIEQHLYTEVCTASEVNDFINFLNECFRKRNNFMIDNFNTSNLKLCLTAYNKIKTNILSNDTSVNVFDNLTTNELKIVNFILFNLQNKYNEIDTELCISYQAVKNVSIYIKTYF